MEVDGTPLHAPSDEQLVEPRVTPYLCPSRNASSLRKWRPMSSSCDYPKRDLCQRPVDVDDPIGRVTKVAFHANARVVNAAEIRLVQGPGSADRMESGSGERFRVSSTRPELCRGLKLRVVSKKYRFWRKGVRGSKGPALSLLQPLRCAKRGNNSGNQRQVSSERLISGE